MAQFSFLIILTLATFFEVVFSSETPTGNKCSQGQLQECLKEAKILSKNGKRSEALEFFKKACDGGEMQGCGGQGALEYLQGNTVEAKKLLKKACDAKEIKSCEALKKILKHEIVSEDKTCSDYPLKIASCTPFRCNFTHPFVGIKMKKEIVGVVEGKCKTTEEMPNNGSMECHFPKETLKDISEYYKLALNAKEIEGSASVKLADQKVKVEQKIDGKTLKKDPMNEALQNGTCKVSGY